MSLMWCWSRDRKAESERISIYDSVRGQMWACNHMLLLFFLLHIVCAFCKSLVNALLQKKKTCLHTSLCLTENIINVYVIIWQTWYLQICVCLEYKQIEMSVLMEAAY